MLRLCLILLLSIAFNVFGQNQRVLQDTLGAKGIAKFSGVWVDSLLPKQGNFELNWRITSDSLLYTYLTKGRLKSHKPEGRWTWEQADWDYAIEPGNSIVPVFTTSGERKMWTANFLNGQAHGNWVFTMDSLAGGKTKGKEFVQIQGKFNQGRISETLVIKDDRPESYFMLTGQTDKDGVAIGKWVFRYKDKQDAEIVTEERFYQKGILTDIKLFKRDSLLHTISFHDVKRILTEIEQAKEPLPYRIGPDDFESDGYERNGTALMKAYLAQFIQEGWQLPHFNYQFERKGPIFRKIQYPLSENDLNFIAKSDSLLQSLIPEINLRLGYRNIFINRGRNSDLDLALAFAQSGLKKLQVLDSLLESTKHPHFTYTNTLKSYDLIEKPLFRDYEPIKGEVYDTPILHLPPLDYLKSQTDFENIFRLIKDYQIQFSKQLHIIDTNYFELQKESALLLIEDRITEKLKMVDSLYAGKTGAGAMVREKWVQDYLRKRIKVLSQSTEIENAQEIATSLERKLDKLIAMASDWTFIDSIAFHIKEQYTHFAYNPYTGHHDIELRIKKRFYNKITQVLLPWLYEEFQQIDQWDEWIAHVALYKETWQHLMAFALLEDKASKRIDRRIRKEKSPARMQKILAGFMRE